LPRRMAMVARVLLVGALVVVFLRLLKHFLPNTYAVIKDWQTLVAGLVGFGGLAWVTYENAKLGRARDDRVHQQNIDAEKVALEEKAKAFAAVVSWQIAYSLLEVVTARKRLANLLDSDDSDGTKKARQILQALGDIPPTPFFEPSSLSSISLLPGELVGKVCGYYYELHDVQGLWRRGGSREEIRKFESRLHITLQRGNVAIDAAAAFVKGEHDMPKPLDIN